MTTTAEICLITLAGVGGGLTGSIGGLASIVSYPALLAVGLSPVSANVTNTVALTMSAVGSVSGSGPELKGKGREARRFATIGVAGGGIGALLLLTTPQGAFARTVPWLVAFASVAILLPRTPVSTARSSRRSMVLIVGSTGLVSVYGGYFGAGAGVLALAVLMRLTSDTLPEVTAMKNLMLGAANAVAACAFGVLGPVHWAVAAPLGLGFLIGGRVGPVIVRRMPIRPLRLLISGAGIGLAVHLALR